ncbi:MAG: hypothetical protein FD123_2105 [Bacteroidetes bacterium]|nr:MAG: hypothetical protein FD123_2105 [Bacteroidota bacterium]
MGTGKIIAILMLASAPACLAQNLVPNPSFEDTSGCSFPLPQIDCLDDWNIFSGPGNPVMNTADLCYNGAVFFPPSTIPAYDGTKYIGIDCQPINSEFVQVRLSQPLQAGMSYCVSFYAAVCDQTPLAAPSLGAYFSATPLLANPFTAGMSAHVQSTISFSTTQWQQVSGTYIAAGGEEYLTLGGFQNASVTNLTYMYIDFVDVTACPVIPPTPPVPNNNITGGTIYLPNAFTPNGDGTNDFFPALGEKVTEFSLQIFDRWGQLIFSSDNLARQWDGKYRNRDVQQDVYVYKLFCRIDSEPLQRTGTVTVVR